MQPYFFPYLGYYQLIAAVDAFVVYDDVMHIKRGWVNRNSILINCRSHRFTIPLSNASSRRLICETEIAGDGWKQGLLESVRRSYSKAPCFADIYPLVESVVTKPQSFISALALDSLVAVMDYLGLEATLRETSRIYGNAGLKGQERILDICRQEKASAYINLPGGRELYSRDAFAGQGLELYFLQPNPVQYPQLRCDFVPNLSILDVLMFNDREAVQGMLRSCSVRQ
jgi:hypothetical protein